MLSDEQIVKKYSEFRKSGMTPKQADNRIWELNNQSARTVLKQQETRKKNLKSAMRTDTFNKLMWS